MTTYLALLRAVNLGSHNQVAMADLRDLFTKLGLSDPRTLLQSGNVVFRATARAGATLERMLEAEAEEQLGLRTDFFVRTAEGWEAVVAANHFRKEAERDPGHLVLMALRDAPEGDGVSALRAVITGRELVRVEGRQAYIVYPDGIGRSRLTNALIEKKLGTRGTAHNWNTVLELDALAGAAA
jgi:uncharacterized protein (DUF1697 family)